MQAVKAAVSSVVPLPTAPCDLTSHHGRPEPNSWSPDHLLVFARFNAAITAPVAGEIVNVPSLLETDVTEPAPHAPQVGGALEPDSRHWPAVAVPAKMAKAEAPE